MFSMKKVKIIVASAAIATTVVAGIAPAMAAPAPVNYFQKYNFARLFGFTRVVLPVR